MTMNLKTFKWPVNDTVDYDPKAVLSIEHMLVHMHGRKEEEKQIF